MQEPRYLFSKKMYNRKKSYVLFLGLLIATLFCVVTIFTGAFNIFVALVVYPLCFFTAVAVRYSMGRNREGSMVYFQNGLLNYMDVAKNYLTKTLHYEYEAYHYVVYHLTSIALVNDSLVLTGYIEQTTIQRNDYYETAQKQILSTLTIPNYFENREHLLQSLNYIGG